MPAIDPDSDRPLGDTLAAAAPKRLNARALLTEVLHIDAKLDAYKARRAELRTTLEAEALRRYAEDDAAPSWKVARLGSATLCATESEPVTNVTDDDAYSEWVLNEHPTEAEVVIRIPGQLADADNVRELVAVLTTIGCRVDIEPAPAFLASLEKLGRADPETGQLWAPDGQVVPGVTVTKKDPYLSIRLVAEAKARARAQLADVLPPVAVDVDEAGVLADLGLTAHEDDTPHEHDDEGAGDAPPPDEVEVGPETTSTIEVGDPEAAPVEVEQVDAP